jgi:hypothetical protein
MKVVHHRRLSRDLVAIEGFGKDPRDLTSENMVTLSALLMEEMIENLLGLGRLTFDHGSILDLFEFQYSPTIRTHLSDVDRDNLIGRLFGVSFSPMAFVTGAGSPLVISVLLIGIGFKRALGGRSRGAKESLLILPFLVA